MQGLARDLEILFKEIEGMDAEVLMGSPAPGASVSSVSVSADDSQINRLLLKVTC